MTALVTSSSVRRHAGSMADDPDPEVPEKATRRRFPAAYKAKILAEYDAATDPGEKGALLRREGLYSSHISAWRQAREAGGLPALDRKRGRKPADPRDAEVARLRKRAERAEAELAQSKLIIDAQGKLHALLENISRSADCDDKPTK
jgi:transposase